MQNQYLTIDLSCGNVGGYLPWENSFYLYQQLLLLADIPADGIKGLVTAHQVSDQAWVSVHGMGGLVSEFLKISR